MFALGNQVKADLLIDLTDLSLAWKNTGTVKHKRNKKLKRTFRTETVFCVVSFVGLKGE